MNIHINERPFACDTCDKTFVRSYELKQNKIIHTNELRSSPIDSFVVWWWYSHLTQEYLNEWKTFFLNIVIKNSPLKQI